MKNKFIILSGFLIFIGSTSIQAQGFGNKIKNKVLNKLEDKANQKIDKAIDSAVDKPVDKAEDKVKESVKGQSKGNSNTNTNTNTNNYQAGNPSMNEADMANFMEMMNKEVTLNDFPDQPNVTASPFTGTFDMVIESYKKNGSLDEASTISWYIDKYDMVMIPETKGKSKAEESKIIMNRKKGIMIVLADGGGEKMGMVMRMSDIGDMAENFDNTDDGFDDMKVQVFKDITEVIDGKKCFKVVVSDTDYEAVSWVTESIELRMDQLFGYMGSLDQKGKNSYEEKFGNIQGWAMKTTSTDKKTGEKTVMRTKNINAGSIPAGMTSTAGHKLIEMPNMANMPFMNQGK